MRRREFLMGMGAVVAAASVRADGKRRLDPNLAVLVSDCHVNGAKPGHEAAETEKTIAEILKLDPLPAKVIHFGDIAVTLGLPEDYAKSRELFRPLEEAGVELSWMMGNHDKRAAFAAAYPEWAASTEVKGRLVHVVRLPSADLVLLDSQAEAADPGTENAVDGEVTGGQVEWLADYARRATRPYFVCAHHDGRQMKPFAKKALDRAPMLCGYLHGHRHSWMPDALHSWTDGGRLVRSIGLPSGGAWGDIGFVTLRDMGDRMVFTLHERDSWFPKPPADGRRAPACERLVRENDGATVTVDLPHRK